MILFACLWWLYLPSWQVSMVLLLPLAADGFLQLLTRYESTNFRRLVTGIVFGYGLMALIVWSHIAAIGFGYELGKRL